MFSNFQRSPNFQSVKRKRIHPMAQSFWWIVSCTANVQCTVSSRNWTSFHLTRRPFSSHDDKYGPKGTFKLHMRDARFTFWRKLLWLYRARYGGFKVINWAHLGFLKAGRTPLRCGETLTSFLPVHITTSKSSFQCRVIREPDELEELWSTKIQSVRFFMKTKTILSNEWLWALQSLF